MELIFKLEAWLDKAKPAEFLAPLAIRLYLVPIFWMAGANKYNSYDDIVNWFGNAEWGLGLPLPGLMAFLATATELAGAVLLLFGLGVRYISIPLMITMLVAAFSAHIQNGWLAIATGSGIFATERTEAAVERLDRAKAILQEHGNYDWLTQYGEFVVLNNGIEFAITYFIMLLALFYLGGGKASVDYLICKKICPQDKAV